jgi:hypothetical protein
MKSLFWLFLDRQYGEGEGDFLLSRGLGICGTGVTGYEEVTR